MTTPHAGGSDGEVGRANTGDATVQLLVENDGNRAAIREMLDERYDVETGETVGEADLYLVEDRTFARHHEDLQAVVERSYPVFRPVVVVRRTGSRLELPEPDERDPPLLVDDVVDAPLDRALLVRRLETLLVRRHQSKQLQAQVAQLEQRERELRSFKRAVEHSGHSIIITDSDGTIEYVNPAFETVTGYDAEEAIGRTPAILKSGHHDDEFYRDLWGTILDGEVWEGEVMNARADGEEYVVAQTIAPITDGRGDVEGFVSVNSEITERIWKQRELERRERELDLLRQILSRVLRHNFRNEFNVILGRAQQLQRELEEPYATIGQTIVDKAEDVIEINESARTIASLIEGSNEIHTQDLSAIAERSVEEVRARFPDATVTSDVPPSCSVEASSELQRAVTNLVENAVEHNDATAPRVDVRVERDDGGTLVVADNGPGIPESELVPIERGEETPLEHGSSIDLWLVNWVVEQSHGTLAFDSTEDGTCVRVSFPEDTLVRREMLASVEDQ